MYKIFFIPHFFTIDEREEINRRSRRNVERSRLNTTSLRSVNELDGEPKTIFTNLKSYKFDCFALRHILTYIIAYKSFVRCRVKTSETINSSCRFLNLRCYQTCRISEQFRATQQCPADYKLTTNYRTAGSLNNTKYK